MEVNPCHFAIYDRNSDGVITDEELREVFPDRNLADGLFQRLDIEGWYIIIFQRVRKSPKGKWSETDDLIDKTSSVYYTRALTKYPYENLPMQYTEIFFSCKN